MTSVWLQELTSDDVEQYLKREATIIVPIGATETHGAHLPLGTDTYEAIATETHRRIRTAPDRGVHGCEFETSHMLFKRPDLVRVDRIELSHGVSIDSRFVHTDHLAGGDKVMWITTWHDQLAVTPSGHLGDPREATVEKGQALWDAVVNNGVEFIEDMRRFSGARHE